MITKSIKKISFSLIKPKIILVEGEGRKTAKEAIFQGLKNHLKIKKVSELPFFFKKDEVLILENDKDFEFLMEKSSLPILVITHVGDIPSNQDFFAGEEKEIKRAKKLAKILPVFSYLVLNFDDETVREIKEKSRAHAILFGFDGTADLKVSDVKLNKGTNFKLHYNGSVLPVWLENTFGKEQIYAALVACAIGKILKLNLVNVSQSLKNYHSLPGKMKLIEGIKNSWILDDSESATTFSMIEALEILGKITSPSKFGREAAPRKIAVLGDVVGIGKYTTQAHEAIGEQVVKNTDILFIFGQRAKFIAKGAFEKGMALEKIFQFNRIEEGKLKLQDEIREGDLILVDGSKEMEMEKIVEEIKGPIV